MKLEKFRRKNPRKIGIAIFTVGCIFLLAFVFIYSSFASFQTNETKTLINGDVVDPGDLYFAFYVDGQISKTMPGKDDGYSLVSSTCTNGASVEWLNDEWAPKILNLTQKRTKCTLYFEDGYPVEVIDNNTHLPIINLQSSVSLDGRELVEGEFSVFLINEASGEVVEKMTNDAEGIFNISLTCTEAGDYTYILRLVNESGSGVTCDETEYTMHVKVVENIREDGYYWYNVVATIDDNPVFHNSYKAEATFVTIITNVLLRGENIDNYEFEFQLTPLNGAPGKQEIVKNDADASIIFSKITFDKVGVYQYELQQVVGKYSDIKYDESKYVITITVEDDNNGHLSATPEYSSSPIFENEFISSSGSVEGP